MSKLSELKSHVLSLEEIRDIIEAMKNLSIVEINKVSKYMLTQKKVVDTIENTAKDFFSFYNFDKTTREKREIGIIIGSERGFCGGFNEMLLNSVQKNSESFPLIAIGKKLHSKLKSDNQILETLDGANTIEEIDAIVTSVIKTLGNYSDSNWVIVYNEDTGSHLEQRFIRPFQLLQNSAKVNYRTKPILNMKPENFSIQLMDQYLFALIYHAFFTSFTAENRQRLRHMDGAVSRIDNHLEQLHLKLNRLRQEEITEEIEVILLNVGNGESE